DDGLAETIEGAFVDEAAVRYKSQDAGVVQPVCGPAEEAGIHVVDTSLLGSGARNVARADVFIDGRIRPVLVVVELVELADVVGRVPNHNRDFALVLRPDAFDVFLGNGAEKIVLMAGADAKARGIVEGVDEAQMRELDELALDCRVSCLD